MIRPSLRQFEYLIAIEDEKSFLKAADKCGCTQSTLSAGIKELENILRQPLVIRSRKHTTLTPLGAETVERARKIISDTELVVTRANLLKDPLSGPLRLGIIPTIAPYMLPEILPRLEKDFPKLELELHEDLTDRLLEKMRIGQLDVALMAFPYDTPGMTQHFLFEEPFYAALPPHSSEHEKTINIKALDPDKLLLLEGEHCLRDHALLACDIQTTSQRKTFSATSLATLIQMVRQGFGMTLLPEMACRPDVVPSDIRLMRFSDKHPPMRGIGLCWNAKTPRNRDYEALAGSIKHID